MLEDVNTVKMVWHGIAALECVLSRVWIGHRKGQLEEVLAGDVVVSVDRTGS